MNPYYEDHDAGITIYNARCEDVLPSIDPEDFAVLLTDPPYGIGYRSGFERTSLPCSIEGDEDTELRDGALHWWGDRPALIFGTWRSARPAATRARLIWDTKGALGMGDLSIPWKPSDQEIYVLGAGFVGRRTTNVVVHAPVQSLGRNGRVHPHEKPVGLMMMLLEKCPTGPVIDPFMGSGPIAQACHELGRRYIGIELVEDYCRIAVSRLAQQTLDLDAGTA